MYVIVVWLGMLILVALNNSCYVCVSLFVYHVHLGTLLLTRPCAKLSRSSYVKRGVGTLCLFVCLFVVSCVCCCLVEGYQFTSALSCSYGRVPNYPVLIVGYGYRDVRNHICCLAWLQTMYAYCAGHKLTVAYNRHMK